MIRVSLSREESSLPSPSRRVAGISALCLALGGCGFGTAAVIGSSGGGSSNGPPAISGFDVVDPDTSGAPKRSPAEIRFVLADTENDSATVEFLYQPPNEPQAPMAHLPDLPSNPVVLSATKQGTQHTIAWDFASEDELYRDARFTDGVVVYVRVNGAAPVPGTNEITIGLGNDPPEISADTMPAETSGVVPVRLHISDSSSDALKIRVEYDVQGDDPDAGWKLARPAGLAPGDPTPDYAFDGIVAQATGSDVVFFWDSDFVDDLHDLERDVLLRITAIDPADAENFTLTNVFRVDNNEAPILQLHADALLANPDSVRGIPVPFTMIDEESDDVTVVFQWRREGEAFPELPDDPAMIEAIAADEGQRRQYHVCAPYPLELEGSATPIDGTHVRLPGFTERYSHIQPNEIAGSEIRFPRAANRFERASAGWSSNPLTHPVAALPSREGTHALILDGAGAAAWRLVEVDLRSGTIDRTIATGGGSPSTFCFGSSESSALIASHLAASWGVDRVDLATGNVTHLVDAGDGQVELGEIRGIESLGSGAALVSVGSSLVRVDWSVPGSPRAGTVRSGLATPWGIIADPLRAGRVYVAENTAVGSVAPGRILSVDVKTWAAEPLVVAPNAADGLALPRPRGLAILRKGSRLVAVCETVPSIGTVELRGVELGAQDSTSAYVLDAALDSGTNGIAAATREDLLVATSPVSGEVVVAGGIRQRATVQSIEGEVATLTRALDAPLGWRADWQMRTGTRIPFHAVSSPEGVPQVFTWDSSAGIDGGLAYLRATPIDAEIGTIATMTGPKHISGSFDGAPARLGSLLGPYAMTTADLDHDGDLDIAVADSNGSRLVVLWQTGRGSFDPVETVLGGKSSTVFPYRIQAVDIDANGLLDLLTADWAGDHLTIFLQSSAGVFDPNPLVVGDVRATPWTLDVRAADLDSDGDLDLVSATGQLGQASIFWQTAPGTFDPHPLRLGTRSAGVLSGALEAADLDGDGDADIITSDVDGRALNVFWQVGGGSFDPEPTILLGDLDRSPSTFVEAVDVDGDGHVDLLSGTLLCLQTAPRVFESRPLPSLDGTMRAIRAADLDGDGDLDLLCAHESHASILWQTAPGTYDSAISRVGGADASASVDASPADIDGDGNLDVVSLSGTVDITFRKGFGDFAAPPSVLPLSGTPYVFEHEDMDADGLLDLLCSAPGTDGEVGVLWQGIPGSFGPNLSLLGTPHASQLVDLDGDGDLDLVGADTQADVLLVYLCVGPGTFDPEAIVLGDSSTTHFPYGVQAVDLDGDGLVDLACPNRRARGTVTVFWQTTPGVFDPVPTLLGGELPFPYDVRAVDLDVDGDRELVFLSGDYHAGDRRIGVFWQVAPRVFDTAPTMLGGNDTAGVSALTIADLDGDGPLELVSGNNNFNGSFTLTIFWQTVPGTFDPTPTTLVAGYSTSILASDIDQDGDVDLVTAGSRVSVYWQVGPRTFDPTPTLLGDPNTIWEPRTYESVDVDRDGDLDLLCMNYSSVSVFWQRTPGKFDPVPRTIVDIPTVGTLDTADYLDLDRDGERDLLLASLPRAAILIYWGGR